MHHSVFGLLDGHFEAARLAIALDRGRRAAYCAVRIHSDDDLARLGFSILFSIHCFSRRSEDEKKETREEEESKGGAGAVERCRSENMGMA